MTVMKEIIAFFHRAQYHETLLIKKALTYITKFAKFIKKRGDKISQKFKVILTLYKLTSWARVAGLSNIA